jgi:hypothetical protein
VLEDLHGEQFLKAIDIVLAAVSDHSTTFARRPSRPFSSSSG